MVYIASRKVSFDLPTYFFLYRQEVNEVMTSLRRSLGDVSKDAQAAVASLGSVEGTVEQVSFEPCRQPNIALSVI